MKMQSIPSFHAPLWTTLALLLSPGLGTAIATAQSVEPVFPLPNTENATLERAIELKLTQQPQIQLDTIQVLLNGNPIAGNLSISTVDRSLRFQGTPAAYNVGTNTLQVQFKTQAGVQSQFTWPFSVGAAAQIPTPTPSPTTPDPAATPTPLKPEVTTRSITGNTLVLAGTTRPGANVTLNVTATRPSASLVDLGPIVITAGDAQQREMSAATTANNEGVFRLEFNVSGDPRQTQYEVEAIARQGEQQETTTLTFKR